MNKKRFIIVPINKYGNRVYDKLDDKFLSLEQTIDLLNDYEKNILILTMMDLPEMENVLIKQSSIIRKDEIAIKTMMSNMEKLEEENEQLKKEFKIAIEELITDYNKLEEKNEQLRKDKAQLKERLRESNMRLDRFNCR